MKEQHSLTSLANRIGMTRTATRGALLSGRLPAIKTTIGAREIFTIQTDDINRYKADVLHKLQARVAKITSDPIRQQEIASSAAAAMRDSVKAENVVWTPARLADLLGCSLDLAGWLLQRHGERIEGGFRLLPEALTAARREREQLNNMAPRRNSNL